MSHAKRGSGKRAGVPSVGEAVGVANRCISDKVKQIAGRTFFNITGKASHPFCDATTSHSAEDPDHKVGPTISDLAAFMVPVGPEAEAEIEITERAIDLAIPGSVEGTRILKQAGEGSFAPHFADEDEAKRVADSLKSEEWQAGKLWALQISAGGSSERRR